MEGEEGKRKASVVMAMVAARRVKARSQVVGTDFIWFS